MLKIGAQRFSKCCVNYLAGESFIDHFLVGLVQLDASGYYESDTIGLRVEQVFK